jgi:hypothetical protein
MITSFFVKKYEDGLHQVSVGDTLIADSGFTCLHNNQRVIVKQNERGEYVDCSHGRHYLDGQVNENGILVGLHK